MANPGNDAAARRGPLASPPLVAVAGWLLPGAGYWIIGERARALTVCLTIVALFLAGILIGGVRAVQVPGYGENGGKLYLAPRPESPDYVYAKESPPGDDPPKPWIARDAGALLRDVGNKPWSICQVLAGPLAIGGGAWSVAASRPVEGGEGEAVAVGVLSHSRVNEIAVLYTAVAGMLNLLVIIDAATRAARDDALHGPGSSAEAA